MEKLRNFYSRHSLIITIILIALIMPFVHWLRIYLPFNTVTNYLVAEVIVALIVLGLIYLINGSDELKFSTKGMKYTFKILWFVLFYAGLDSLFIIVLEIYSGEPIYNPVIITLESLIFGLFVGLFEEGLFRGLLLSALLENRGDTFKGVLFSCIVSSLVFGFIHIYSQFFGMFTDLSTFTFLNILQMVGKTITTAMMGFAFAVVYLRTHNLWGVAIVHGINDALIFISSFLFNPDAKLTDYVNTGVQGMGLAGGYVVQFIFILPVAIYAFRQLKYLNLPQWGLFKQNWQPHNVEKPVK